MPEGAYPDIERFMGAQRQQTLLFRRQALWIEAHVGCCLSCQLILAAIILHLQSTDALSENDWLTVMALSSA